MKKLIIISMACLVMSACSDSDKGTVSGNDSVSSAEVLSVDTTSATTDGKMSTAEDLPSHWVLMTKKGKQLVVQNYCDKENPSFILEEQDDGTTTVSRNNGMLSEVYKVVSFQKLSTHKYLMRIEGQNGEGIKFLKINYTDPFKGIAECSWTNSAEEVGTDVAMYVTKQKAMEYSVGKPTDCQ